MRFLRQSLSGLILVSLTLGLLALTGQVIWSAVEERIASETDGPPRRERVFAVHVMRATMGREVPVLTAFGEVQSLRTLEIRAKTGGTLVELADEVVEGGSVRAGQFLARIDPAEAQARLDNVQSDLADAKADALDAARRLDLARDELAAARDQHALREQALARQRDLVARGVGMAASVEAAELAVSQAHQSVLGARQDMAAAEARIDQAANALDRAGIDRAEAERQLRDTVITARFTGRLSGVMAVEGGLISTNERFADLVDAEALEVAFRVSTSQFSRLLDSRGQLVLASVSVGLEAFGADSDVSGQITRAGAAVGEGQTGRLIFARLSDRRGLKPGDFVTVRINEPALERAVRLPASALGADGSVLVLGEGARLEAVAVDLLRRQGDDVLLHAPALNGRDIVVDRSPLLGPGIKVRPLSPNTAQASPTSTSIGKVRLSDARRARMIAFVREARDLSADDKDRLLRTLEHKEVPTRVVQRLEAQIGG